jgi:predicted nucleic acid-binding protein
MSQALNSVIESLNTLSLEEKHQLWQILDNSILQLDINILISALLSPQSKPYRCVYLARTRNIKSVTCKEILDELKDKLSNKLKYLALSGELY